MPARILSGRELAAEIRREVAVGVAEMRRRHGVTPGLATVLVGDDPAATVYVRNKRRACREAGMVSETARLPATASQAEILAAVRRLSAEPPLSRRIDAVSPAEGD